MKRAVLLAGIASFGSMAVVFVLKTLADTVFLAEYGAVYVPHFMVAEAVTVVSASALYSVIIRRRVSVVVDGFLLSSLLVVAALAPWLIDRGGLWVFAVSLFLSAIASLANLAMWNAATGILQGRRARSLVPTLSAAATAGAVVGSFGASGLTALLDVIWLGPFAAVLLAVLLALQILLLRIVRTRARLSQSKRRSRVPPHRNDTARWLLYVAIASAVVGACLAAVVELGFKAELEANFDRRHMGVFFALFYGVSNLIVLLMQLFVTSRLLASQPLRTSLAVQPASMLVLSVLWFVSPGLVLATLARGVNGILKFGIERPTQEVTLMPLGEREQQRAKVLIRGVYAQGGNALAGLALVVAGPWLVRTAWPIALAAAALAVLWLWLQRWVGRLYLDTLGSTLGMNRLLVRPPVAALPLDRDGLDRVVAMLEQPESTRLGQELIAVLITNTAVLAPYLAHPNAAVRRVMYQRLATRPSSASLPALRQALAAEPADSEPMTMIAGLHALAALYDPWFVTRARELATGDPASSIGVARAAWQYLAQVGALDDDLESFQAVVRTTLGDNGRRVAAMCRGAMTRDVPEDAWQDLVLEAMDSDTPREGFAAAAALGNFKFLAQIIKGLEARTPGAQDGLIHLESASLAKLVMLANARSCGPRVRERVLRGLRGSVEPGAMDVALRWLDDDDAAVRDAAVHTLLHWVRVHGVVVPSAPVSQALGKALDRLRTYVVARRPPPSYLRESNIAFRHGHATENDTEFFFIDELERRTEHEWSKVCELLALLGNPNDVFAAARELRGPTLKHRVRAVDVLQEIAPTAERTKLFEMLDRYLHPSEPTKRARRQLCERDPWLARCLSGELQAIGHRLSGLRAVPIFDEVPGEALVELADATTEHSYEDKSVLVAQGEHARALYIVLSGTLQLERDGERVGALSVGQYFGELALVDGQPRQTTVRAVGHVHVLRVSGDAFEQAQEAHAEIRLGLVRGVARWLRQASPGNVDLE